MDPTVLKLFNQKRTAMETIGRAAGTGFEAEVLFRVWGVAVWGLCLGFEGSGFIGFGAVTVWLSDFVFRGLGVWGSFMLNVGSLFQDYLRRC